MAAISTAVAIGVSALATGASIYQGQKAQKAQERAADVQRRQREAEAARNRRKQVAQARARRAAVANVAGQTGTADSSGAISAQGSIQSQLGENLGFTAAGQRRASIFEDFQSKAAGASTRAGIYGSIGNLAMQGSSLFSSPTARAQQPSPRKSVFSPVDTGSGMRDSRTNFSGLGL